MHTFAGGHAVFDRNAICFVISFLVALRFANPALIGHVKLGVVMSRHPKNSLINK